MTCGALPYQIAALCYLFDEQDRVLLLHRGKPPNKGLYSPIGGKLEQSVGESPTTCAIREIGEETGLHVSANRLHLSGIVSESGYENECHWLMFLFEVTVPVGTPQMQSDEGVLSWHAPDQIERLAIPQTDRQVIWPLFWKYRKKFFAAHIDCSEGIIKWWLQQPAQDVVCDASDPSGPDRLP